ncbi:hypothetical protein BC629DRAFT_1442220 [Irpex lacteus]|nr:hypothetical protein BC629DRAFT_1442220 [Irpex lacteus]
MLLDSPSSDGDSNFKLQLNMNGAAWSQSEDWFTSHTAVWTLARRVFPSGAIASYGSHCGQGARSACALHCPTPSNGVIATRDIFGNVPEAVLVVPDDADNTMACLLSLFDSPSRFLQYRGHAIWILTLDLVCRPVEGGVSTSMKA